MMLDASDELYKKMERGVKSMRAVSRKIHPLVCHCLNYTPCPKTSGLVHSF